MSYIQVRVSVTLVKAIKRMNLAPAKSDKRKKAIVTIHVDIVNILSILEDSEVFNVQFKLTKIWQDRRLTYLNLKNESFKNIVSKKEGNAIWYPVVLFTNTANTDQTLVGLRVWKWICIMIYKVY